MNKVLHVLPHTGGGAETYLELLSELDGWQQRRFELAAARTPLAAAPSIASRLPKLAVAMRSADIVHVHGDAALLLVLPHLRLAPVVWTTHGLHLLRRHPRLAPFMQAALARVSVAVCTSQAEANELTAVGPALSSRIFVVPNGVSLPPPVPAALRAQIREELGLAHGDVAALFLGELESRKGPLDAIAAVGIARASGVPLTLLLAGRGPLAGEVRRRAGDGVLPLGFRDDPQRLLAAADVFLLPSEREGHSFALLEAMARGLPVIVSDGAGNPEAVGDAGLVVPFGDPSSLADALRRIASDPDLRMRLGEAARERVASELTPQQLREGVLRAYGEAFRGPAQAASAGRA